MKIQGQGYLKGSQPINAYKKAEKITPKAETLTDSLELSDQAKEIAELQKKAAKLPDVRQELIRELKQKISTHSYHVPSEKLAGKLYEEMVTNKK